jgi:hypothetical protein
MIGKSFGHFVREAKPGTVLIALIHVEIGTLGEAGWAPTSKEAR